MGRDKADSVRQVFAESISACRGKQLCALQLTFNVGHQFVSLPDLWGAAFRHVLSPVSKSMLFSERTW